MSLNINDLHIEEIRTNTLIKIIIDKIEVEAHVLYFGRYDFLIEIIKPFKNLSGGLHVPYYGRKAFSYNGEYGRARLIQILEYLYTLGKYLSGNMDVIKELFHEVDERIKNLESKMITEKVFREVRINLRKLLRSGAIDDREYQQKLNPFKESMDKFEWEKQLILEDFYKNIFPFSVGYDNQKEITKILKGENPL